jgi:molybdate transport system ATP-binding protein
MIMIQIKDAVTRLPEVRFDLPVNWTIDKGEQWAVIGPEWSRQDDPV